MEDEVFGQRKGERLVVEGHERTQHTEEVNAWGRGIEEDNNITRGNTRGGEDSRVTPQKMCFRWCVSR